MILRAASIALALFLAAPLSAIAQQTGGDDDILNPGVLDRGGNSTPTTQTPPTPRPRSTQAGTPSTQAGTPSTQAGGAGPSDDDILGLRPGTTQTEPVGDEPELEYTLGGPVKEPPPGLKPTIDREIAAIEARAQQQARTRARITETAATNAPRAEAEVREEILSSDDAFDRIYDAGREGAADEVEDVGGAIEGRGPDGGTAGSSGSVWDTPEWRENRGRYLGSSAGDYDPSELYSSHGYEPIRYPNAGTPDSRMSWWQKLLLKSLEGVAEGVKGLSERHANELRRREEKLRREYPEYRAYVEAETRSRIERAAFANHGGSANAGYDRRLDDLILGPARSGASGSTATATPSGADLRASALEVRTGLNRPVARLPRVRDPVTNEERIEIDMPLGVDPVRPLR